jgi:hypothetical protein
MSNSNLPANIADMATGLAQSVATVATAGGDAFMKMTKIGVFVFGAEETEVEEGSQWAVNPAGFQHGFIAWGTKAQGTAGRVLGEHLGPAAQPIFPEAELEEVKGEWSQQIAIQMRCMTGADEGLQTLYKANSDGGRKAYGALLSEVVKKIQSGDADIVPVVVLESGSYKHDEYGQIFYPIIKIVDWVTMEGLDAGDGEGAEEESAPKPKKAKKKKKAKKAKKVEAAPAEEEVVEQQETEESPAPRRRHRHRSTA